MSLNVKDDARATLRLIEFPEHLLTGEIQQVIVTVEPHGSLTALRVEIKHTGKAVIHLPGWTTESCEGDETSSVSRWYRSFYTGQVYKMLTAWEKR